MSPKKAILILIVIGFMISGVFAYAYLINKQAQNDQQAAMDDIEKKPEDNKNISQEELAVRRQRMLDALKKLSPGIADSASSTVFQEELAARRQAMLDSLKKLNQDTATTSAASSDAESLQQQADLAKRRQAMLDSLQKLNSQ